MRILIVLLFCAMFSCSTEKQISALEKISAEQQDFLIQATTDTILEGKNGSLIYIDKLSFVDEYGNYVTDSVQITLKEVFDVSDILTSNTTMSSEGKMLETGGMIEVRAYSKGNQLSLGHGKLLVAHFPKQDQTDSMRLFYGNQGSNEAFDEVSDVTKSTKEQNTNNNQAIAWDLEESSVPKTKINIDPWYHKYDGVDNQHLIFLDNTYWYDTLPQIFNFSDEEVKYFLNKTSKVHYNVSKKGELKYTKINGSTIRKSTKNKLEKIAKNFPIVKPYTIKKQPIDMPGWFQIWSAVIPPKYMDNDNYLKQLESKIENSDSTKSNISVAELQYYIFDSKKMGWMNCDQFVNPNPIQTDFRVKVPKSDKVFVKIVFTNYKTVMIGDEKKGAFIFDNLPLDEPIKVIVIDEKDGNTLVSITNTTISKKNYKVETLEKVSLSTLQKMLQELH